MEKKESSISSCSRGERGTGVVLVVVGENGNKSCIRRRGGVVGGGDRGVVETNAIAVAGSGR